MGAVFGLAALVWIGGGVIVYGVWQEAKRRCPGAIGPLRVAEQATQLGVLDRDGELGFEPARARS